MTTMIDVARKLVKAAPKCAECECTATRAVSAEGAKPSALCSRWQCFDLWIQTLSLRTQRDEAWEIEERPAWKHAAEVAIVYGLEEPWPTP